MWNKGHKTILREAERQASEMRDLRTDAIKEMEATLIRRGICQKRSEYNHSAYDTAVIVVDKFDEFKLLMGQV